MAASTFSYAQAAKGISAPAVRSKPASGAATPAKDANSSTANGRVESASTWADDAESESATAKPTAARDTQSHTAAATTAPSTHAVETPHTSSPDLGASASSASTATKDDDVASLPNASSESTWDNKSQASTSVDKSVEPVEKTSEKATKAKNVPALPLQEAPLPAVNIWKKRADDLKSKTQKSVSAALVNGNGPANKADSATGAVKLKGNDEEKSHGRKETRGENDAKKDGKPRHDVKGASSTQPPPPTKRDQESWPTPETAINEDRKKAQEKGDRETKEHAPAGPHGKQEWVKVPYTPSVVFSTPLPNAANSRRGGRGGARGASQSGGRSAAYAASGASQPEKDGIAPAFANGDHVRRDRADGSAPRDSSPKAKRAGSAASPTLKDQAPFTLGEKPAKSAAFSVAEAEFRPATSLSAPDPGHQNHQNGSYSRPYANRQHKPRRGDMAFAGERRRDSEVSPAKDNTFDERQHSSTQTDGPVEGERRHSTYYDGSNGHQYKQGRFSLYHGREPRGARRGGRGYTNGHTYTNGHMTTQSSSSFSLGPRSPTTFHPENANFFPPPSAKYARSNNRSQSVTNEPYRFAPYQGGPPVAPIPPTYNMYDYGMMQPPMTAVPYTPYMDQYALMAMITTQVEYYFSVDNLLKDMYLRRKMDSQGFVSLEFIAGFNRIKQLSTDLELVKLVCQQSNVVQYRTGEDGRDRLRRREGWEQWVLDMAERDAVAQNDGPKELHQPPVPHPAGFDLSGAVQWPMSAVEPTGPYLINGSFVPMNGYSNGIGQEGGQATDTAADSVAPEQSSEGAVPNGHPVETPIES
ncbi:hypothetical protein ACEQ8H_005362 [Pleosporales sp. CAS-2024a]